MVSSFFLSLLLLVPQRGLGECADDPNFVAQNGLRCSAWSGVDCLTHRAGLNGDAFREVLRYCPVTCDSCIPAADFCDTGVGPTKVSYLVSSPGDLLSKFDLLEDPLLNDVCDWSQALNGAEGIRQNSDAYGNNPGDNSVLGCLAMLRGSFYRDFVMSVDVRAEDDDAFGIVFGFQSLENRYQVHVNNDRWPDVAADGVPGPHMKFKKRNGKPVLEEMDAATNCKKKFLF